MTVVSPAVYTITISGITGSGTLGLNLVNNGSILDSGGGSLSNSSFTGQVYTINQVWPFVESINRTSPAGPATTANVLSYTVSFSEAVTGVSPAGFALALTGTATGGGEPGDDGQWFCLYRHHQRRHGQWDGGSKPGG